MYNSLVYSNAAVMWMQYALGTAKRVLLIWVSKVDPFPVCKCKCTEVRRRSA